MRTTTKARLDSLNEQLEACIKDLSNYSYEELNQAGRGGGWSAMQCLQHLYASETQSLNYIKKKLSYDPKLPKNNAISIVKSGVLWAWMRLPFKYKAPPSIATDKLPPTSDLAEVAANFRSSREELSRYLEELDPKWYELQVYKHPVAGRITLNQMLSFFHSHFLRHSRQAKRALKT